VADALRLVLYRYPESFYTDGTPYGADCFHPQMEAATGFVDSKVRNKKFVHIDSDLQPKSPPFTCVMLSIPCYVRSMLDMFPDIDNILSRHSYLKKLLLLLIL
jgi:hypothetical protein